MNWIDFIWPMSVGVCLTLAGVHLLVWLNHREDRARLAFTLWAVGIAFSMIFELQMMHAPTPAQYGELLKWVHFPLMVALVGFIWFVKSYFKSDRMWLMWLIFGVFTLQIAVNILTETHMNFSEITASNYRLLWGELVVSPVGSPGPRNWVRSVGLSLVFIFILDAIVSAWRNDRHRKTLVIGIALLISVSLTIILAITAVRVNLNIPPTSLCLPSTIAMMVIALELSRDLAYVNRISRELELNRNRMSLAAEAADLGMWEWDIVRDRFWLNEISRTRLSLDKSEPLNFNRFLQTLHPDDCESTRQALLRTIESGPDDYKINHEYSVISPEGTKRLIAVRGWLERSEKGKPLFFRGISEDITGRRQMEDALKESEEQLAEAEEISGCGSWSWDIESDNIVWSKGLYRLIGLDPKENRLSYYSGHSSLYTPESWKKLDEAVQRAIRYGEDYELKLNALRNDGRGIDVLVRGFPIRNDAGQIVRLHGSVLDITRHNFMEKRLRQSEKMARSLLNATHDITHLIDEDGIIIDLNDAMADALHGTREDLIGACVFDRFPKASAEYRKEIIRRVLREQEPVRYIDTVSSGEVYSTTIYPVEALIGEKRHVVIFAHDITELEKAAQALKKSEAMLREAQRIAHIGNWEHDLQSDVSTWSDEVVRIFEIDPELESKSFKTFLGFLHPEDRDKIEALYEQSLKTRKPVRTTYRLLFPDGRIKYVHSQCEISCDPEGKPLRAVGTMQDITNSKQAESERIQLRNELAHLCRIMTMSELSTSLAHEINQPLGAIRNNARAAQILYSEIKGEDMELDEILSDIISDSERASDIIIKIRGLVKKKNTVLKPVNLNVLIEEVVELYRNLLNKQKISIFLNLQPDLAPAKGDPVLLQQVLMNLVSNATEAMSHSASRELKIRSIMQAPDTITVSVSDSGTGIDDSVKNKLFQPFFTTKEDGLGMGLRISHSIIQEHNGRIWLESSRNPGVTFSFTLKAYQGDA